MIGSVPRSWEEEAERRERRRRPRSWEGMKRKQRRHDRDDKEEEEEAERRERRRRPRSWEEMKREQRRHDRDDKEREVVNDRESWKQRVKDKGNENAASKDEGKGRQRQSRWDKRVDNGGTSHATAPPSTSSTRRVQLPAPLPDCADTSENISKCLLLENVFDGSVERDAVFYWDVKDHIHRGCVRCGVVDHMFVDRKGLVYLRFDGQKAAIKAKEKWHGELYEGRKIIAKYMNDSKYRARFPYQRDA